MAAQMVSSANELTMVYYFLAFVVQQLIKMNTIFLLLSCHIIAVNGVQIYRGNCRKESLFKIGGRGTRLDANIISSKTSSRLSLCAKSCIDEASCKSFNYNVVALICQLLSKDKNDVGAEKLLAVEGWNHYQPVEFMDTPRCRTETSSEMCAFNEACDEVCENPVGYKCRALGNIALGKATAQTSTCSYGYSPRAVDGDTRTSWIYDSCTHTCEGTSNWWRVDFGKSSLVHSVKITNRGDCCGSRLSDFNIRIGNSTTGNGDNNSACTVNQGIAQGATKTFLCRPRIYGRYLYVQSNITPGLTLCEVQVFGE
ncbi:uncharacterized protein LOC135681186 isoform X2 [Rhopilema esculentum]|uniref:uncharacterized protein LOC135681186 isoform X2 n=1 Tax=Rhopilema esculentum TaxID=499914 RepID=UPI0031DF07A0